MIAQHYAFFGRKLRDASPSRMAWVFLHTVGETSK